MSKHRIKYSWYIFYFVICFVLLTLLILVCVGKNQLQLSDDVLITLFATNMVQVVGVLYIVAKWLYPYKQNKASK